MGSDCTSSADLTSGEQFQSTLPGWGATTSPPRCSACPVNFNPRSPDGERRGFGERSGHRGFISIHAPRMGSDRPFHQSADSHSNFNPRSPDGERLADALRLRFVSRISIHAPRMGSDYSGEASLRIMLNFNPRSPDGERQYLPTAPEAPGEFQSTLPGWGATRAWCDRRCAWRYFNPRSPDGERRVRCSRHRENLISIHAPRMGSDRENGHLRPRYGQNHPFSTLIVSQIVVDVLGTVRKSQKTPAH